VALTWPLFKVSSTEEEEAAARDKDEFKASEVNATAEERAQDAEEGVAGRQAFRRMQLQDENGQIPPDGWSNAYQEQDEMPFLPEAWSEFLPSGAEVPNPWVSIGPGNIGGRIRSIIIHPNPHAEIMWIGGVSGGVWKTLDKGETWSTTTDQLANLAVTCMAIDPTNPDILYAGTGEGFFNIDAVDGNGIFKTTDGGNYWEQLSSTAVTTDNRNFVSVNRLVISPTNPQFLLAATTTGIFRSTDGGGHWSLGAGILTGVWDDVRFQPANGIAEPDIPDVPAINCLAASRDGRIYYSADNGATWATNAGNGLPPPTDDHRIELAYSRSTPMIVYASQAGTPSSSSELFRSTDGGFSFDTLGHPHVPTVPSGLPGPNGYTSVLWVDPINPDTVVVGGVYLLRTMDRGAHWEECDALSHQDTHVLVEHPGYNRGTGTAPNAILYSGNDGGLHRTNNILAAITPTPSTGSVVWSSLNNSLGVTQFYGAASNAATGVIVGGTQDNGTVRFFGDPAHWDYMRFGDGGFCAADQVGESEQPYYYGEGYQLTMHRSTTAAAKHRTSGAAKAIQMAFLLAKVITFPARISPRLLFSTQTIGIEFWQEAEASGGPTTPERVAHC
jgi:hypothetical protein